MKTNPLTSITLSQAMAFQFRMINEITKVFHGADLITRGDLGVVSGFNKPQTTAQAERVIASFFGAEAALLVRGAGTAAIRYALFASMRPGDTILVHQAPVYPTTITSFEMMGLKTVYADFNDINELNHVLDTHPEVKAALVQYTRQKIDDGYDMETVVKTIKRRRDIPIITDDNYAVMKVDKIGTQCGADLSCFSTFKLLGPEGIGCIVGKKAFIDMLKQHHYSGGLQTQGHEALDVLHGLVYAPVALAIQAQVNDEVVARLCANEIPEVKWVGIANAQSKVLLVEFHQNIAKEVCKNAVHLGAAPHPVGAESKYEMVPMFYRVSGTFSAQDATLEARMIRINPMRSGADTIIRILKEAIKRVM